MLTRILVMLSLILSTGMAFADQVYEGIGIEIGQDMKGHTYITYVFPNSPAQQAMLMPNDMITAIDGKEIEGMSLDNVSKMIRGQVGTKITMQIYNQAGSRQVEMVRALITVQCFLEGYYNLRGNSYNNQPPTSLNGSIGGQYVNLWVAGNSVSGTIKGEYVRFTVTSFASNQTLTGYLRQKYVSLRGNNWNFSGYLPCIP